MSVNNNQPLEGVEVLTGGLTAGLAGGIGMGLVLQLGPNVFEILGALIGSSTIVAGWLVHLTLSILFGIVFATIVSRPALGEFVGTFESYVGAGIAFGAVLGILAGGLILPVAVSQAGVAVIPLPYLPLPGLAAELLGAATFAVGHLVYGTILGAVLATIVGAVPARFADRTVPHE